MTKVVVLVVVVVVNTTDYIYIINTFWKLRD